MLGIVIIALLAILVYRATSQPVDDFSAASSKLSERLGKLWDIAHQGMRENRLLRAEKALLTILKIDERNAPAYNRLGILYAKQREYRDAIDCFEIASSIEATPPSLHNLGLIYFETENYEKAGMAFQQALQMEDKLAARHVAYAKVQEKLGNEKLMFQSLNRAIELEPIPETFQLLAKAYRSRSMAAEADIIEDQLKKLIVPAGRSKRVIRAKRVAI